MKIVVVVKEVPDTYGERTLNEETGLTDRLGSDPVLDEIGERALELALSYADTHEDTEISVVTMAPEGADAALRKCLARGAHTATHIVDPGLLGADLGLTAEVLAAAIRRESFDLVITGDASTDGAGGVMPAMLAELLDLPHLTGLNAVQISPGETSPAENAAESSAGEVAGPREVHGGTQQVAAELPAVVSITEALPEARFPDFAGIKAARSKPIEEVSLADLGIDAEDYSIPRSIMLSVRQEPARESGTILTDEGDAAEQLTQYLVENGLVPAGGDA